MSTSISGYWTSIFKEVTIILGLPILIAGILGGILNIIVFLSLKTFRQSSCAFFLTVMSFVNVGQLLTSLLSRIMITGFGIDWTETSLFYCKFRSYCLQVCALTSFTCMCLATIDQFLATSLHPRWQQYFTIRQANILCGLFFVTWLLHGIPILIWYTPSISSRTGTMSCVMINVDYQKYSTYFYTLILCGFLPIVITVLFGSLAYWNVRQIPYRTIPLVRRELDKQLTSMVLVQVVHNFFIIIPYISILIILFSTNLAVQSAGYEKLLLGNLITGLLYYLYFASPFYIYVCVSKRFRQQLGHVISNNYTKRREEQIIGINQVIPII